LTKYGKVEAISPEEALKTLHHSTGAGYSFHGKRKGEVLDQILEKAKSIIIDAKSGVKIKPIPCTLASRGHLRLRHERKRRVIFVYPAEIVLLEQMFVHPIYELLKSKEDCVMYFGKNVIPRLSRDSMTNYASGMHSVNIDFSKFDTTVIEAMIAEAFSIIRDMIDFEHFKGKKISPAEAKRWMRVLDLLEEFFTHTPVLTPDGKLFWIDGSVPSGSGFTQLVDSIVAMIAARYVAGVTGCTIRHIKSLGDDVRLVVAQRPRIENWAKIFTDVFGLNINIKKTKVKSAKILGGGFLGYDFDRGYITRNSFELFNLALHPEHEVKTLGVSVSRLIAYMFIGGANDKRFTEFFVCFQEGYDLSGYVFETPKEMVSKVKFAGWDIPIKPLNEYTMRDFVYHMITFKR